MIVSRLQLVVTDLDQSHYLLLDGYAGKPSANGVLLNGQKIISKRLQSRDVIIFGPNVQATYYHLSQEELLENLDGPTPVAPYKTEVIHRD
jgi:pSer/pThr/pTyr-binding forkhead associated (FHA) protein